MKRLILCLFMLTIFCTACTKNDGRSVIKFASWGSQSEIEILKPIIADFEKENPNLKIDFIWAMHLAELKFLKRIQQLLYSKYFFLWHGRVQFLAKRAVWSAMFMVFIFVGMLNVRSPRVVEQSFFLPLSFSFLFLF